LNLLRALVSLFQFNRTNWKAVALCFVAATVFWLFNSLNKKQTTNVRFPLHLEYDESRYTPSASLPHEIVLNVSGNGWELFRKHFGLKVPTLSIKLSKPVDTKKIPGTSLLSGFAGQVGNLQINLVVTDTLRIHLEEKKSKKLKIIANLSNITFRKGLGVISPVVILPDSVTLTGPRSIIRKTDSVVLILNKKKIDNNFREQIEINLPNSEFIHRDPPVVEVIFEVGNLIEIQNWIKLKVKNKTWGTEIEKDSIRVILQIPQRNIETFDASMIYCTLDLKSVKKGETKFLTPSIEGLPPWTELTHIDSVKVKYY
jgi:YbbR-like protein